VKIINAPDEKPVDLNEGSETLFVLERRPTGAMFRLKAAFETIQSACHGSVWGTLMNILLVDDYRATTEVLADVARSMGHAVSQAYSGVEALVVTTGEGPFDLILLGIALPDISGHEVCLRLRASERYASRRIVSLSAHVDLCDHFDMSCFDGCLLKPLALSEFESLLSDRNEAHKSSWSPEAR
jgi:two-component system OmpR family response regulator